MTETETNGLSKQKKIREKPMIETLLFEKFFLKQKHFKMSSWKRFEGEIFNTIKESIAQNVFFILNTTNSLKIDTYLNKKLTFLDFGVPDFLSLYQTNNIELKTIEKCIQHAITSFEPRLVELEVTTEEQGSANVVQVRGKIQKNDIDFFQIAYCNLKK